MPVINSLRRREMATKPIGLGFEQKRVIKAYYDAPDGNSRTKLNVQMANRIPQPGFVSGIHLGVAESVQDKNLVVVLGGPSSCNGVQAIGWMMVRNLDRLGLFVSRDPPARQRGTEETPGPRVSCAHTTSLSVRELRRPSSYQVWSLPNKTMLGSDADQSQAVSAAAVATSRPPVLDRNAMISSTPKSLRTAAEITGRP